jgi:hypothetical protein
MSLDAMKQALEALEKAHIVGGQAACDQAITALRLAIEQAERQDDGDCKRCGGKGCVACDARCLPEQQEPVAWQWLDTGTFRKSLPASAEPGAWRALYTAPLQRQPLTEEEIERATECDRNKPLWIAIKSVARAIERAHGIGGGE